MDRRKFLKTCSVLSGTACAGGLPLLTGCSQTDARERSPLKGRKWGMVIDLNKCLPDCNRCADACRKENNVAYFGDERYDIHWIRKVRIKEKDSHDGVEKPMLLLCNHCENPPCAQVCPVQATYKREDGIVIVDHHRCIGCRYCMIACPYNERAFNFKENPDWPNTERPKRSHGVTESCHFCAHRLDQGMTPACVEACASVGANAIKVGNLNDPNDEVSTLIATHPVKRLREDLGTEPKVHYIGL